MSRIVVLASGSGTNLQALIDLMRDDIVAVFCNRKGALALERATRAGIPAIYVPRSGDREAYDADLAQQVLAYEPDLVVLAGWMHVLSNAFLSRFGSRSVINLHPALMPDDPAADSVPLPDGTQCPVFRGKDALAQALAHGVAWVGSSVHYVTVEVDRGDVIAREAIPVPAGATAEAVRERLLEVEHRLLPAAVLLVAQTRVQARPSVI
ncbi:MAG: phosphoribosylglycinamide formyltransferase [Candidatus Xenobia bacterium]